MDISSSASTSRLDPRNVSGSIVVAVNGSSSGWQALEWAAAEAAARRSSLRIIHVIAPPLVMFDPFLGASLAWCDPRPQQVIAAFLDHAIHRARLIAPDVTVSANLECGDPASAIRSAGRSDVLTVVGRGRRRRFRRPSSSWRIARRGVGPVAIVNLDDRRTGGPSAGRVVLGVDGTGGPASAVEHAFLAASRRGVGLTVVHAWEPWTDEHGTPGVRSARSDEPRHVAEIEATLRMHEAAHPEVDVRCRFVRGSACQALVDESRAAALLVIGAQPYKPLYHALFSSLGHAAFRWAHSPIEIVRTSTVSDGLRVAR